MVWLGATEYFFCLVKTQHLLESRMYSESAVLLSSAGAAEEDSPFLRLLLAVIPLFMPSLGCNISPMCPFQLLAYLLCFIWLLRSCTPRQETLPWPELPS